MLNEGDFGLILSVQSHVAYGHVGNRAAVFPLERLGHEVVQINTVNFSNHSGYGKFQGDYASAQNIVNIFNGVADVADISRFKALLTGYIGTQEIAKTIKEDIFKRLKAANPNLVYCLDPVIGEVGKGIFVKPEVAEYFKNEMISVADIITPNLFEAEYLSDIKITSYSDAKRAADILHSKGPRAVVITSLKVKDTEEGYIDTMLSYHGRKMLVSTPEIPFPIPPNGCGDLFSAIFLGHYLKFGVEIALEKAVSVLYTVLKTTQHADTRELQIILAQDKIVNPEISIAIKGI